MVLTQSNTSGTVRLALNNIRRKEKRREEEKNVINTNKEKRVQKGTTMRVSKIKQQNRKAYHIIE